MVFFECQFRTLRCVNCSDRSVRANRVDRDKKSLSNIRFVIVKIPYDISTFIRHSNQRSRCFTMIIMDGEPQRSFKFTLLHKLDRSGRGLCLKIFVGIKIWNQRRKRRETM